MASSPGPGPRPVDTSADAAAGAAPETRPSLNTVPTPSTVHGDMPSVALVAGARPLPEYELVRLLGRGGFGEVWLARGPGGFDVALKFIRLGTEADRVELGALAVMRDIRHAHLLPVFGTWQAGGYLIVAMEKADRTLLDRLREAQAEGLPGIPPAELHEYMQEAAKGLDYLNERRHPLAKGGLAGIQHKDVKPQNLLLVGGSVKVADFGLARLLEHTISAASGGMTPAYAAPEFLNGQATRWSDQYCLAVTYCQLRGGKLPFDGNPMQVVTGHLMHAPDLSMLPEAERPAVLRALAKKPEQRWPSCRAFAEALAARPGHEPPDDRTLREPPAAAPPSLKTEPVAPPRRPRRRRWPAWAAAVCLLAVAAAIPVVLFRHDLPVRWPLGGDGRGDGAAAVQLAADDDPSVQAVPGTTATGRTTQPVSPPKPAPVTTRGPAPVPLRLLPVADITLPAGERRVLKVSVERPDTGGDVRLEVAGLPRGVTAEATPVARGQSVSLLTIRTADADVDVPDGTVVLRASLGDDRAEQHVRLVVRPRAALRVLPFAALSVTAGKSQTLEVRVERRHCPGPVRLELVGLPAGVTAKPATVPAGADTARIEVAAAADAAQARAALRVRATTGSVRAEQEGSLAVEAAAALRLLPIPAVVLHPGETRTIAVHLSRGTWSGPVEFRLDGLPAGVQGWATGAEAGAAVGTVNFVAANRAAAFAGFARLSARAGTARPDQRIRLTVGTGEVPADRLKEDDEAIAAHPNDPLAYLNRGHSYRKALQDPARALTDYSRAVSLDPKLGLAHFYRGMAYNDLKDHDQAVREFAQAIRLDPTDARSYAGRGLAYRNQEDYDRAVADFTEALRLDPKFAHALLNRGITHGRKKDYDRAVADCTAAIAMSPTDAVPYNELGNIYLAMRDYDRAFDNYSAAIRLDPKFHFPYRNRGLVFFHRKDLDRAVADFSESIRLDPKYAAAYTDRGRAYVARRDTARATADFTEAIRAEPTYAPAYYNRGLVYAGQKEYDRAIADFTEAIRYEPKSARAHNDRGIAYLNKQQYDRAIEDFTRAIQLDPNFTWPYNNRGNAYARKRQDDQALADYDEAIRRDPKYAVPYNNRGLVYFRRQDYDRAITDYDEAIRLSPRYALPYRNRADAYQKKGDAERAKADREKAASLEAGPKSPAPGARPRRD